MALINLTFHTLKRSEKAIEQDFELISQLVGRYADDFKFVVFTNRLMSMTIRGISKKEAYNLLGALFATLANDEQFKSLSAHVVTIE